MLAEICITNVTLVTPGSTGHMEACDVFIADGKISSICKPGKKKSAGTVINGTDLYLSSGWFDLHVNFREPGHEYKEDLESGCRAAMKGGFTGVLVMPSTEPALSTRSSIEFIHSRTKHLPVDVYAAGTLSHNREGKDLSEMYDMHGAGATVFTDDKRPVRDAGLMMRALLYAGNFGGKIFSYPEDKSISGSGQMNEGTASTMLGLKGMPAVAEEVMIARDIALAEYTAGQLHFSTISTKGSVELIRKAKARGLKITADVSAAHLLLDDSALEGFDTVFKMKPPLRTKEDREALVAAVADGTIDCICSDHTPEDIENKRKEFDLAAFGISSVETAFACANTALRDKAGVEKLVEVLTKRPREIAGVPPVEIAEGKEANLTLFDTRSEWIPAESDMISKSKNNPFIGRKLTGRPVAIINRNQVVYTKDIR